MGRGWQSRNKRAFHLDLAGTRTDGLHQILFVVFVVLVFEGFQSVLDVSRGLQRINVRMCMTSRMRGVQTFGSRFRAMVKCRIAEVLSPIILYRRPSMKWTIDSSGAISLRISSSMSASFGFRSFISTRAFMNRVFADLGSRSQAC
jgi:hypothetical protein